MKYLKNFNTEAEYLEYIASADNLPHISYIKDINKVRYNGEVAKDEPVKPKWTGHADAEGLRAIGWTEEDIAYYQENGVNWNAEDDQYHLVSEDNKALYGVLTADNISTYADRIVYLPKIDTSGKTDMYNKFSGCKVMVATPTIDTSNVTEMASMFSNCSSLTCVAPFDTSKVTTIGRIFYNCVSLISIPPIDTSRATHLGYLFSNCKSLISIPPIDTSNATSMEDMFTNCSSLFSVPPLDASNATTVKNMFSGCSGLSGVRLLNMANVTNTGYTFQNCYKMTDVGEIDAQKIVSITIMFSACYSLVTANIANLKLSLDIKHSALFSKESLLYIINNEAAESAITITLHSYAYTRLAEDADIVAALANHPNVSLASA